MSKFQIYIWPCTLIDFQWDVYLKTDPYLASVVNLAEFITSRVKKSFLVVLAAEMHPFCFFCPLSKSFQSFHKVM